MEGKTRHLKLLRPSFAHGVYVWTYRGRQTDGGGDVAHGSLLTSRQTDGGGDVAHGSLLTRKYKK